MRIFNQVFKQKTATSDDQQDTQKRKHSKTPKKQSGFRNENEQTIPKTTLPSETNPQTTITGYANTSHPQAQQQLYEQLNVETSTQQQQHLQLQTQQHQHQQQPLHYLNDIHGPKSIYANNIGLQHTKHKLERSYFNPLNQPPQIYNYTAAWNGTNYKPSATTNQQALETNQAAPCTPTYNYSASPENSCQVPVAYNQMVDTRAPPVPSSAIYYHPDPPQSNVAAPAASLSPIQQQAIPQVNSYGYQIYPSTSDNNGYTSVPNYSYNNNGSDQAPTFSNQEY